MLVTQIATLMNSVTGEILGDSALVAEDLSNIVDVGEQILNATNIDNYVKTLLDHIGRVVFVNRVYEGSAPSVLMDGWEYGAVLEKIRVALPEATDNESWELKDGESYDPNVFYKPTVSAKFFSKKVTFEVPVSFTEMQVVGSLSNAVQLNSFLSMIENACLRSMDIKLDSLIMRTINNFTAETVIAEYTKENTDGSIVYDPTKLATKSGVRAVNLLYLYNTEFTKTLTAVQAIKDPDFLRYASFVMGLYIKRLSKASALFNIGGTDKFTPARLLHIVMLSEFESGANVYLQSDVFHNELTKLPNAESVPYWQGSGTDYSFSSTSAINLKTASGTTVSMSGVLAVMFDRDALGVSNLRRRTTSNYNPKAEFFTNWHKADVGYFNDMDENFVMFFVA